jgi:hypothetical protein
MEMRSALKEQYHAGLAMLSQSVRICPDDLWRSGTYPRTFERIAFHAAFFTQLYAGQNESAFQPWPDAREDLRGLWGGPDELEPYELPPTVKPLTQGEMMQYLAFVDGLIDPIVDNLDLEAEDTGFPWYKNMSKLSHELMNLRHLQGHVGQLSELLMARDIDIDWVGKVR